jgi:hypothetical protein
VLLKLKLDGSGYEQGRAASPKGSHAMGKADKPGCIGQFLLHPRQFETQGHVLQGSKQRRDLGIVNAMQSCICTTASVREGSRHALVHCQCSQLATAQVWAARIGGTESSGNMRLYSTSLWSVHLLPLLHAAVLTEIHTLPVAACYETCLFA